MLKAGDLRHHRITIQVRVLEKDSQGDDVWEWVNLYTGVPAAKVPLSVNQFMAAQAQQSRIKGRFVIRQRPGLDVKHRVLHNDLVYEIEGWLPDPESGREYITAPYGEGVNQGGF